MSVKNPPIETLRDRFAMAALTGMISVAQPSEDDVVLNRSGVFAAFANSAYGMADAMMEERKREENTDGGDGGGVAGSGVRVPLGSEAGAATDGQEDVAGRSG